MDKGPNTDAFLSQISLISDIEGDVAEMGTFQGRNSYFFAQRLLEVSPDKTLHCFDSFEGFPRDLIFEDIEYERFDDTALGRVQSLLSPFDNVVLHAGSFNDTLSEVEDKKFSLVILDCDLTKSYEVCMDFYYDKLVTGGIMLFDEYYSKKYPFIQSVVDGFFADKPETVECFHTEGNGWTRWRVVKQ